MFTKREKDIGMSTENINNSTDVVIPDLPNTLTSKQTRFVQLYVTGQYTIAKLAQLLEVHPNTIGSWLRRQDVRTAIESMQETTHHMVANQLTNLTTKALQRLGTLIDSPIDGVAMQAVRDVLDRTGHKPKQEVKKEITITTFEEKMKDLIDKTIDVEYEIDE